MTGNGASGSIVSAPSVGAPLESGTFASNWPKLPQTLPHSPIAGRLPGWPHLAPRSPTPAGTLILIKENPWRARLM
jgi:hypothetical protein